MEEKGVYDPFTSDLILLSNSESAEEEGEDEDDAGRIGETETDWSVMGCCFPDRCCMPGFHLRGECYTAEMAEDFLGDDGGARQDTFDTLAYNPEAEAGTL